MSERNPAVSNRLTRSSAPPGVNNNPGPADPAGSQANNGVGDLFDRLFHPTGATARNSTRAATAPALGAPIQLRNSASSSTGSNGNSVLRASSVVQRLIDDVRSRPSPGASSAAIERQLVGDNPRVGPDNLNQERPRS
ncbi:hypothetical protein PtA15_6A181, partial [Puccinia triticina]